MASAPKIQYSSAFPGSEKVVFVNYTEAILYFTISEIWMPMTR